MNLKGALSWAEEKLKDLPAVAFKTVELAILNFLTLGWGATISLHRNASDTPTIFWTWLVFLASLHGINLRAFMSAVDSPTTSPSGAQLPLPPGPPPPPPGE